MSTVSRLNKFTSGAHITRSAKRRLRDVVRSLPPKWEATRDDHSFRYLRGEGIEIGAFHKAQRVREDVKVTYVDYAPLDVLMATYVTDAGFVQPPDVVDDAEHLREFADGSLDFVIANHVVEHLQDPIQALSNFVRVLKAGGIIFLTLPDARESFDGRRERTTIEHLRRDHEEGPEVSRREHYREWAHIIEGMLDESDIERRMAEYEAQDARHHFHVWELDSFLAMLFELDLPVTIEAAQATDFEFAVTLRKKES